MGNSRLNMTSIHQEYQMISNIVSKNVLFMYNWEHMIDLILKGFMVFFMYFWTCYYKNTMFFWAMKHGETMCLLHNIGNEYV